MPDREKVIKGLECCEDRIQCENCPYGKPRYIGIQGCTRELVHDALALLQEQEGNQYTDGSFMVGRNGIKKF